MFFAGTHTTTFTYSTTVVLEPQSIRLRPRCDALQRLVHYTLHVEPTPAGASSYRDVCGNATTKVWFDAPTPSLTITTTFGVETSTENPFDYLLNPEALSLPVAYEDDVATLLAPYQARHDHTASVETLAETVADQVDGQTIPFLGALAQTIRDTCEYTMRPSGPPWRAEETLQKQRGACRDLAVLFMEACRAVGLAARFVSGYQGDDATLSSRELHAWVEVYLPGAGWRGYDPTIGLAVADHHVALAAGMSPGQAAPTVGTFRGTGVSVVLDAHIRLLMAPSPSVFDLA